MTSHNLRHIVAMARDARMSTTYKPALLKAIVRVVRDGNVETIPIRRLALEFAQLYWVQTNVFHLRQAAVISKEPGIIRALRAASDRNCARLLSEVPSAERDGLVTAIGKTLTIDVLRRFHASKPDDAPPLFEWNKGEAGVRLVPGARAFILDNQNVLLMIADLWWARYLESVNVLAPAIIEKVERDGARRGSLAPFLAVLNGFGEDRCFYCERALSRVESIHVDHVIPWSFILADPLWDLVLTCSSCNLSKSDRLPAREFIAKLEATNERRVRSRASLLLGPPVLEHASGVSRLFDAAVSVEWPRFWTPGS